ATAMAAMNHALTNNDSTEAGIQRVQADYWKSEVSRAEERVASTKVTAPFDGVVSTPRFENIVGRHYDSGDVVAEVIDTTHATVDVALDESSVALLNNAKSPSAAVKLDGFPSRTFRGKVTVVSPRSEVSGEHRIFYARVDAANSDNAMKPGMTG